MILAFVAGLLVLPVILAVVALVGWLPSDAVSQPPGLEQAIGEGALDASLGRRAKGLHNPVNSSDTAALLAGEKLFRQNCAGCHGGAHADSSWGARNFYPRVPQFWRVEEDDVPAPQEAFVAIRDGVRYSGMGAWNGMLSERQMWQVANFVSRMHHLPPDVAHAWQARK
ncbi:MAG: cytochrome c [Alphaproteobacteria bacterium]|nr:cytochrome c [Alphaproteobacteria bacterium]